MAWKPISEAITDGRDTIVWNGRRFVAWSYGDRDGWNGPGQWDDETLIPQPWLYHDWPDDPI